jgi:DNA polymerase
MQDLNSKITVFNLIASEAEACRLCPDLCERRAVLSERNGPIDAKILFIGEAPGRQGADRTRIPFSGDQSGRNFDRFLASVGLTRDDIFITSAVLCNPRGPTGANRSPKKSEIENCSGFLRRVVKLIDPEVVVTLGSVALAALKRIEYHELSLKEAAGTIYGWNGRWLVPLYHPSPQVLASHRREDAQLGDYKAVQLARERVVRSHGII